MIDCFAFMYDIVRQYVPGMTIFKYDRRKCHSALNRRNENGDKGISTWNSSQYDSSHHSGK